VTLPASEQEEIINATDNPIGVQPLKKIVHRGDKVALICEDISRFACTNKIIKYLVSRLNKAGVSDKDIQIVIALGSHRPMKQEEMIKKVSREIFSRIAVVNSEFRDKRLLLNLGLAPGGVRVWADKRVIEADVKIGVGSIVPHPALGYTGGGKIIYPGVVAEETVAQLHLRSALLNRNIMGWVDNPVREEMEKWVDTVGLDFIVNAVVTPKNETYAVVAGDHVKAHRRGVESARQIYELGAKEKVDIVVVSSHTADQDFWQGTKGVVAGERIVKNGGTLILVTPCFEGIGPYPSYVDYIGDDNYELLLKEAWEGKMNYEAVVPLSVGALVARIRKRIKLRLVSEGISPEQAEIAKFKHFNTLDEALRDALQRHGRKAKVSVLSCGGDSYVRI
jgi:nickel-dependent lactate racemase